MHPLAPISSNEQSTEIHWGWGSSIPLPVFRGPGLPVVLLDQGFQGLVNDLLALLHTVLGEVEVLAGLGEAIAGVLIQVQVACLVDDVKSLVPLVPEVFDVDGRITSGQHLLRDRQGSDARQDTGQHLRRKGERGEKNEARNFRPQEKTSPKLFRCGHSDARGHATMPADENYQLLLLQDRWPPTRTGAHAGEAPPLPHTSTHRAAISGGVDHDPAEDQSNGGQGVSCVAMGPLAGLCDKIAHLLGRRGHTQAHLLARLGLAATGALR